MASLIFKKVGTKIVQWASVAFLGYEVGDTIGARNTKVIEKYVNGPQVEKVSFEKSDFAPVDIIILVILVLILLVAIFCYIAYMCTKKNNQSNAGNNVRNVENQNVERLDV